ncbi:MAG: flagella basal body P-ring formation protein FlgA [Candidatus Endobugula sp.]|jgi:flagella basal body P-ring formation protein FlgA
MFFGRFGFIFLLMWISVCVDAMSIIVKPETIVSGSTYTLADLALVENGNAKSILDQIVIGVAAKPGYFVDVPLENIKVKLSKEMPNFSSSFQWGGANIVRVKSVGKNIDVSMVERSSAKVLKEWLSDRYVSHTQKLIQGVDKIVVPKGKVRLESSIPSATKARKRMTVWVDLYVSDVFYQTYRFWYQVSAKKLAYVAVNDIASRNPISMPLLASTYVDVTDFNGVAISEGQYLGYQSVKLITSGSPLTSSMLEKIPFVSKGDVVNVYIEMDNVGISTKAIALRNGNIDERISVLNPTTNAKYMAVVIGKNKVIVK